MNLAGGNMNYHNGRQPQQQQRYAGFDRSEREGCMLHSSFARYDYDRMNNAGNSRQYRDSGYQPAREDDYNNSAGRRSNNFSSGPGGRGRGRRAGPQGDAGAGGTCRA